MDRSIRRQARPVRGFSLVELMVSMAIGLVVLAALYSGYQAAHLSSRSGRAVAQITEDASAAMSVLRTYVSAAAYSRPVGANAAALSRAADPANWVRGCDGKGFKDLSKPIADLECETDGPDALAVAFEANAFNSITRTVAGVDTPLNCVGDSIVLTAGANPYYLSYSRFYINDHALFCRGGDAGQALVENIEDMQVTYGVQTDATHHLYKNAQEVTDDGQWPNVVSVRVCLVVRSADEVLDEIVDYQGCDPFADPVTPDDRRLYRAFTSTFVIQNRRGTAL